MFTLTGYLHEIFGTHQISDRFTKREFVLETQDEQSTEHIKFQLVQDNVMLIEPFKVGDKINVDFKPRGRGFNKNGMMLYFTNLEAESIRLFA